MRRPTSLVLLTAILGLFATAATASGLDPRFRFRTLTTPHFIIYFHQGEDRLAARLAVIAEEVWPKVGGALGLEAPRLTHVVLVDQSEFANGSASMLPYNTIVVSAATPSGSEYTGRVDDWLRVVFTHEFTHIAHLDRSEGWTKILRGIFGRTPIAFPNGALPGWLIEGLAQWEESALTGQGRVFAGDFLAVEREAARTDRMVPLDRANGGLTDHPGASAKYIFGLGFHQYLAERFGADRFGALAASTARTAPYFGALAFDDVFGEALSDLWTDYVADAARRANARPSTSVHPATRLTQEGFTASGPRFAPPACAECAPEILYSFRSPHGFPSLEAINVDGSNRHRLTKRYLGATAGVNRQFVVFDQHELHRNVALLSDLYVLERHSGRVGRLTYGERLQDPDLSPDGRSIVCVRESLGQRDLVLVRLTPPDAFDGLPRVAGVETVVSAEEMQFNAPRWSPDGASVAVARHRYGTLSELVVIDIAARTTTVVAAHAETRFVTPAWRPDGRALIAAADADRGPFNLYEFDLDGSGGAPRRLTDLPGGAIWPDVSADGRSIVFAGYTADGFDLFTVPYRPGAPLSLPQASPPPTAAAVPTATSPSNARPYRPWSTIAPTTWFPVITSSEVQSRVGASTGGVDALERHSYELSATWLVNAIEGAVVTDRTGPDWSAAYSYTRWIPAFFVAGRSDTVFFLPTLSRPLGRTTREREIEAGMFFPVTHTRTSRGLFASLVHVNDESLFPKKLGSRARTGTRVGMNVNTAQTYGYSISPERGVSFGASAEFNVESFAEGVESTILTADARAYLPGPWPHHVIALRAAIGQSRGDEAFSRTFFLGGGGANTSLINFGHDAFSLSRGFGPQAFDGSSVSVVNVDYRWPIARPQRGYETVPFFLHTVHAAAFADLGNAWSEQFEWSRLKTSLGGEVAADVVLGYLLKVTIAAGAAWGHDHADDSDRGSVYLRIGRAF